MENKSIITIFYNTKSSEVIAICDGKQDVSFFNGSKNKDEVQTLFLNKEDSYEVEVGKHKVIDGKIITEYPEGGLL